MKKFKKRLQCALSVDDVAALAHRLVDHLQQADTLKLQAKEAARVFKEKLAGQESQAKVLENQIEAQTREQDVECCEIVAPGSADAITLRLDTGEEVSRRRVTDDDKQGSLLTLVPPTNDQEAAEQSEEQRIQSLFALLEILPTAGMDFGRNLKRVWTLGEDKIAEARKWAMQKKSVGLSEEAPPPPEWLVALQQESLNDVLAEKELDIRVNTIKAILVEQSVIVQEPDIRAWSKAEQDKVMEWTDSLLSESPLPRPDFLEKFQKPADPEPWMPPEEGKPETPEGESAVVDEQSQGESNGLSEPARVSNPFEDLESAAPAAAISLVTQQSNGHMSREDMALKIQDLGVDVDLTKVASWSEPQTAIAFDWIVQTQEAINSNGERRPAPEFFFE